jgi:hypothetical protein
VDNNSQPVYAVTMDEHEYAHGSEFLDAIYHLALLPTEEPMNDFSVSHQNGQFGLEKSFSA